MSLHADGCGKTSMRTFVGKLMENREDSVVSDLPTTTINHCNAAEGQEEDGEIFGWETGKKELQHIFMILVSCRLGKGKKENFDNGMKKHRNRPVGGKWHMEIGLFNVFLG